MTTGSGDCPASPIARATATAVRGWSPVTMMTRIPAARQRRMASGYLGPVRILQGDQAQEVELLPPESGQHRHCRRAGRQRPAPAAPWLPAALLGRDGGAPTSPARARRPRRRYRCTKGSSVSGAPLQNRMLPSPTSSAPTGASGRCRTAVRRHAASAGRSAQRRAPSRPAQAPSDRPAAPCSRRTLTRPGCDRPLRPRSAAGCAAPARHPARSASAWNSRPTITLCTCIRFCGQGAGLVGADHGRAAQRL